MSKTSTTARPSIAIGDGVMAAMKIYPEDTERRPKLTEPHEIIASTGKEEVAIVYIAEFGEGKRIECVESLQPPIPREEKWVLLVSTMFGCPVGA